MYTRVLIATRCNHFKHHRILNARTHAKSLVLKNLLLNIVSVSPQPQLAYSRQLINNTSIAIDHLDIIFYTHTAQAISFVEVNMITYFKEN